MIIKKYLPQIETLRAFAAMSVVFFHFDIFHQICTPNECKVIHDNEILISDKDHWSLFGWIYYGKILEQSRLKKILHNIM